MAIVLLLGLLWIVRFWHSRGFGLYEDDLTIIPSALAMSWSELLHYVGDYIVGLRGHIRPLSDSLIYLLSAISGKGGGLWGMYLLGYLCISLNVVLFYSLVRQMAGASMAFLSSLGYVLFSADTSQVFLTHSLGLQPSMTLVLLALHAYVRGHALLSYLLGAVLLFSYETPYPLLLAAPFLSGEGRRPGWKEILRHSAIVLLLLAGVGLLRYSLGEDRVGGLGVGGALLTPLLHMLVGPAVSLGTYFYRPVQAVGSQLPEAWLASAALFAALVPVLMGAPVRITQTDTESGGDAEGMRAGNIRRWWQRLPVESRQALHLGLVGALLLVLAYPLTFTVRPYAISGRDTRVHFAAAVGSAMMVGAGMSYLLGLARSASARRLTAVLLAVWLGLLGGYGFVIQNDYSTAWAYEQSFWSQLVPLVPDVQDGTVILVRPEAFRDVRQIGANTWNLPRVLEQMYQFPAGWKQPPRVYRLESGWESRIVTGAGVFELDALTVMAPPSVFGTAGTTPVIPSDESILVGPGASGLSREASPIVIDGEPFPLKTTERRGEPPYPHTPLHDLLVRGSTG